MPAAAFRTARSEPPPAPRLPTLSCVASSQAFHKHGYIVEMIGKRQCRCEYKEDDDREHIRLRQPPFSSYRQ
jgi:hypothetical protein